MCVCVCVCVCVALNEETEQWGLVVTNSDGEAITEYDEIDEDMIGDCDQDDYEI